jgi:hypothetical protein
MSRHDRSRSEAPRAGAREPTDANEGLELDESLYELTVEPLRYEPGPPPVVRRPPRLPALELLDEAETGVVDAATMVELRARARASPTAEGSAGDETLGAVWDRVVYPPRAQRSGVRPRAARPPDEPPRRPSEG